MESMFDVVAMSTPSLVLRYAAAFFFILVAIAAAYALFKAGKAMGRVEQVLAVEGAVTAPARKAAAFSAGVSEAVGSFFKRGEQEGTSE